MLDYVNLCVAIQRLEPWKRLPLRWVLPSKNCLNHRKAELSLVRTVGNLSLYTPLARIKRIKVLLFYFYKSLQYYPHWKSVNCFQACKGGLIAAFIWSINSVAFRIQLVSPLVQVGCKSALSALHIVE